MKNFECGKHFIYKGKEYRIIGDDIGRNEIECETVPPDGDYHWFKVTSENTVFLII